jgi:hypothetical protein
MDRILCENCDEREFYIYIDTTDIQHKIWSICSNCGIVLRNYTNVVRLDSDGK